MEVFGFAALFGLILGFMFGVGCAAAVIYTIYMGGYRSAVNDSLEEQPTRRFRKLWLEFYVSGQSRQITNNGSPGCFGHVEKANRLEAS
jgi:hypothetical protein